MPGGWQCCSLRPPPSPPPLFPSPYLQCLEDGTAAAAAGFLQVNHDPGPEATPCILRNRREEKGQRSPGGESIHLEDYEFANISEHCLNYQLSLNGAAGSIFISPHSLKQDPDIHFTECTPFHPLAHLIDIIHCDSGKGDARCRCDCSLREGDGAGRWDF